LSIELPLESNLGLIAVCAPAGNKASTSQAHGPHAAATKITQRRLDETLAAKAQR